MKVLFISAKDVNARSNGGELCTNRNYLSFCKLLGKENVTPVNLMEGLRTGLTNAIIKRFNYLFGFYEGLSHKKIRNILSLAQDHEVVFIDSSIHGTLAKKLRKKNYKGRIITFFHNVEFGIKLQKVKVQPWKLDEIMVTHYSEKCACKHSDNLIALNQRDKKELEQTYKIGKIDIIPISLQDKCGTKIEGPASVPPRFIFTGNRWYANIHGLDWFVDNVLDNVDIILQITGLNMDTLKEKYNHPKIEMLGFVEDLSTVMKSADYVLIPVFLGSGMKVKTCEALMYGKNIIGTTEAFEGYEIDAEKVGAVCNTKEEFIRAINDLCSVSRNKFNEESRSYFIRLYSFEATLESFKKLLE